MRNFLLFSCFAMLLWSTAATAQDGEALAVKATITNFFKGFHAQDAAAMTAALAPEVIVQTITTGPRGTAETVNSSGADLVARIVGIPEEQNFQEKLLEFNIQIDGPMAHVWTPYEFWSNGRFHHCGVNSFQLLKHQGEWRIIYLIDTRRTEKCKS